MNLTVIQQKIYELRGQRVMPVRPVIRAEMFDVPTKSLNLSVKRNSNRFPQDFMFRLTNEEWDSLRFQIETLEKGKGRHTSIFLMLLQNMV